MDLGRLDRRESVEQLVGQGRRTVLDGAREPVRASDLAEPRQDVEVEVTRPDGTTCTFTALCRIDTANEVEYFRNGGILQYVLRKLAA